MAQIIKERNWSLVRVLFLNQQVKRIWDGFSLGVLGLNSFIMLYHHSVQGPIQYVVCAGAVGYCLVLCFQSILYRHCPVRRMQILKLSQRAFRLIYTAIYLTSIMLNIIAASQMPDSTTLMAYYGMVFIWAAAWGTKFFWLNRLISVSKRSIRHSRVKIFNKTDRV
ncbi:hypothetical protein [Ruthenibacterium lactatiformans]|jgi:hypothetical protein|uniref:hypothetical protein n=1 Tax=Ruthenibacterium lactatiformans TaxID=1550024 RepID=UPI001058E76D|nr:hypothetical protein [Ruthenibacterium lactatiformans]